MQADSCRSFSQLSPGLSRVAVVCFVNKAEAKLGLIWLQPMPLNLCIDADREHVLCLGLVGTVTKKTMTKTHMAHVSPFGFYGEATFFGVHA